MIVRLCTNFPNLFRFEHAFRDFADTAAVIAQLDAVIAVDTAVAHLAGAMGKPLLLLLPFAADFRWLRERRDSPWYPTARLYRQPEFGDWASVVATVSQDLMRAGAVSREREYVGVTPPLTVPAKRSQSERGPRRGVPGAASFRDLRNSYATRIPGSRRPNSDIGKLETSENDAQRLIRHSRCPA